MLIIDSGCNFLMPKSVTGIWLMLVSYCLLAYIRLISATFKFYHLFQFNSDAIVTKICHDFLREIREPGA